MSAAFKEWAIVCEAIGAGRQSVILRKGGLAEGAEGFSFRKGEFFLYPTWYHGQLERTRFAPAGELPPEPLEEIEIRYAAAVEWCGEVFEWSRVCALESLHVLEESVVRERFTYDGREGVHVAFVRAFRLEPPRRLRIEKRFGGCRSWIELPEIEGCALVSVISDEEHARRRALLDRVLGL